nr:zinc finger protein 513-like isoform X2 [Halyomorpha halys]
MADETYTSLSTIIIKEEEGLESDYDRLSQVKQELLQLDKGGLAHVKEETFVKQEGELLIPEEAGGLSYVKEETFVEQEEELHVPDERGGLAYVKEETFVKQGQELFIPGEDSSTVLSFLQSGNSNPPDMDIVMDKQDLESCDTSSGDDVLSGRHIKKKKRKGGAKDNCLRVEKSYQCPHCDYNSTNQLLKRHMARHTGEKPHQCPHCDYKSARFENLKIHIMARHTGEKSQQCPHCDYQSAQSSNMKRHIMFRHTGEKPHQCPHCDYKSTLTGTMRKHIMARHADGMSHLSDDKSPLTNSVKKSYSGPSYR